MPKYKLLTMKFRIFTILFCTCFLISFISCSNKPKRSRKPVAKIEIQPKKKDFTFGDSLNILINIKLKDGDLASVKLYVDNTLVKESKDLSFNYSISSIKQVGKHNIKVVAEKSDQVQGINFKSFEVLSDIEAENFTYEVVKSYPHNTEHFTQGLEIYKNKFYESTGENGKSGIYQFDLKTGKSLQSFKMKDKYFGEGITIRENKIYQLTYKAQQGFIYDVNNFSRIDSFTYETKEGWGLSHDSEHIIKTDGSEFIHFLDPKNMQLVHKIQVYDTKGPVLYLNELEYYNGIIYANIYTTDYAVMIDPKSGKVIGKINFTGLLQVMKNQDQRIDVLNGIAIHSESGKMYITGKLWPKLFEVKLIKKD